MPEEELYGYDTEQSWAIAVPARFFDNQRLAYEPNFYVPQLQAWLEALSGSL